MSTYAERQRARQRWEAERKAIADQFFAGDEARAEEVLDALPYSAIPSWSDVANVSGLILLASPERDAAVAAKVLREAAEAIADTDGTEWPYGPVIDWLHDRADRIIRRAMGGAA